MDNNIIVMSGLEGEIIKTKWSRSSKIDSGNVDWFDLSDDQIKLINNITTSVYDPTEMDMKYRSNLDPNIEEFKMEESGIESGYESLVEMEGDKSEESGIMENSLKISNELSDKLKNEREINKNLEIRNKLLESELEWAMNSVRASVEIEDDLKKKMDIMKDKLLKSKKLRWLDEDVQKYKKKYCEIEGEFKDLKDRYNEKQVESDKNVEETKNLVKKWNEKTLNGILQTGIVVANITFNGLIPIISKVIDKLNEKGEELYEKELQLEDLKQKSSELLTKRQKYINHLKREDEEEERVLRIKLKNWRNFYGDLEKDHYEGMNRYRNKIKFLGEKCYKLSECLEKNLNKMEVNEGEMKEKTDMLNKMKREREEFKVEKDNLCRIIKDEKENGSRLRKEIGDKDREIQKNKSYLREIEVVLKNIEKRKEVRWSEKEDEGQDIRYMEEEIEELRKELGKKVEEIRKMKDRFGNMQKESNKKKLKIEDLLKEIEKNKEEEFRKDFELRDLEEKLEKMKELKRRENEEKTITYKIGVLSNEFRREDSYRKDIYEEDIDKYYNNEYYERIDTYGTFGLFD